MHEHEIETADGPMTLVVHIPASRPKGLVIFFEDATGLRPTLYEMAARMSRWGYAVLMPDLYYRTGKLLRPSEDDPKRTMVTADGRRIPGIVGAQLSTVTNERAVAAASDALAWADAQPDLAGLPVGLVGYCMGGPFVLAAAGELAARVRAGGAIYGVGYVTDQSGRWMHVAEGRRAMLESVRANSKLRADEKVASITAELYFVYGGDDPFTSLDEIEPLHRLLDGCGVRHTIEVYEGASHGFAFQDRHEYNQAASERHYANLQSLFARNLV